MNRQDEIRGKAEELIRLGLSPELAIDRATAQINARYFGYCYKHDRSYTRPGECPVCNDISRE